MRIALLISLVLLVPSLSLGQGTISCTADTGIPATVRTGGKTELVSDLVLTCSGGTPTAANSPIPQYTLNIQAKSILLGLDSAGYVANEGIAPINITSRQLTADGWSEAILLIDEPHSTTNPSVPLLACGDTTAPATAGVCGMTGTGTGSNTYSGSGGRPNVFQAKQVAADTLQWSGIPIDPPPAGQTRILRITNVRMNANQAPVSTSIIPTGLVFYPSLTSANGSVPISDVINSFSFVEAAGVTGSLTAAFIQQELTASTNPLMGAVVLPECQSSNTSLLSNPTGAVNSTLSTTVGELFRSVFKRKNWAANGVSTVVYPAGGDQNQNVAGILYNTESAFESLGPSRDPNPNPPSGFVFPPITVLPTAAFPSANGLVNAGVADQGFRVALLFNSVPSGVVLFLPTVVSINSGQAVLIATDSNGAGAFSPVASTGGSISNFGSTSGLAQVQISGGSGMAVYEILYSDPFGQDQLSVPIALGYLANQAPTEVIATISVASAPFSGSNMADALSPVPRFGSGGVLGLGVPQQLFMIKSCSQPTPAITLSSNATGTVSVETPVTFTAAVSPATSTGQVSFYIDQNLSAVSDIHASAALLTTLLPGTLAGTHTITAVYTTPAPEGLKIAATTQVSTTSLIGDVDSVTCQTVSGWAADRNLSNKIISVDIMSDTDFLGTVVANLSRPDVGSYLGDNGLHGFSFTLPTGVANVHVTYSGSTIDLGGSPQAVPCSAQPRYTGAVDSASCNGISGWVADQNRPGQSMNVSLWMNGTQTTSTLANIARPDVGTVLGDNGLHGFYLPVSPQWGDGVTKLILHFESSSSTLGAPITLSCSQGPSYTGSIDSATCTAINGWAADQSRLNTAITVSLWDGLTQIASTTANVARPDVGAFLHDNGIHGFSIPIPAAYADGLSHTLQVHNDTTASHLGSPIVQTCGTAGTSPKYTGWVDSAACSGINGWAADQSRLNTPITVTLWDGVTAIASATANASRPDVGAVMGDNGLHGFSIPLPQSYVDGLSHSLQLKFETSATSLSGSPVSLQCGSPGSVPPNYAGYVDTVSCSAISGWAADRNSLNNGIFVDIYDGSTLLGTISANGSRNDVGAYLGDNGQHGFSLATPASLKDGQTHTITVRPGNSSSPLAGPQSLTCN